MKTKLLTLLLLACAILGAKSADDKMTLDRTWIYYDMGIGGLKEKFIFSPEGGIGYEWNQKICLTAYKVYHEDGGFMPKKPPKYSFHGHGAQIGPIFRLGKVKIIPSAGIEFGSLSIGDTLIFVEGWLWDHYHWETITKETVTFVPVSVLAKYNLTEWIGVRSKLSVNIHDRYPLYHMSLGICLGRV